MDLNAIIKQHGPALTQQLAAKAGFSSGQATAFLPLLIGKVMEVVKGGKMDLGALAGGGDLSGLVGQLGLGGLAKQVGVDEAKATTGAKAILPSLLGTVGKDAGGLAGMAGKMAPGGGAADLLKKAGGLFG